MTEEEKKAIEKLKSYKELFSKGYCKDCNELCAINNFPSKDLENNIDTLLNLIEKLEKENKELKEKVFKRDKELIRLEEYANKNFERKDDVKAKYIPKDKIREKLEKIEKEKEQYYAAGQPLMYMLLKNQLKSLLEED